MNERDRVREKIATLLHNFQVAGSKDGQYVFAHQILSLPEIAVLADDKQLPMNEESSPVAYAAYHSCQQDMLKADFRRVV